MEHMLVEAAELELELEMDGPVVIFDCRFSLADPDEGRRLYEAGHIPGAHYLHLDADLAAEAKQHGGRHPLPDAAAFAGLLAHYGVGVETQVIAYDDSRFAFASRLWWMMRALGYRAPRLLNGGYSAWLAMGGDVESEVPAPAGCAPLQVSAYVGCCDIEGVRDAQAGGALLLDSREPRRYEGLEEPIDPVAGHIPGAINRPWQGVTGDDGRLVDGPALREHFGDVLETPQLVVYCGSGVTACVNLFALSGLGREDAVLYAGSWSDWCSYLSGE